MLFDAAAIQAGIRELAERLEARFAPEELTVLAVLRGGIVFAADLIRALKLPVQLDTVNASTYRHGDREPGEVQVHRGPSLDLRGRRVLIVDDILDTGRTLSKIRSEILARGAREVATCVLLDKPSRRAVPIEADFVVFTVPDVWIVGYGLDHDEKYRNLPHIAAL